MIFLLLFMIIEHDIYCGWSERDSCVKLLMILSVVVA